jgi:hypothetical protein
MYRLALIALACTSACASRTARSSPADDDALRALVGVEHPPRHAGVTERTSFLLDDSDHARWVVAEVLVAPARSRGVLLDLVITPGAPDRVRYRTVAVQAIEPSDSLLPLYFGTCTLEGRADRTVVAVGATGGGAIRQAWRADTSARKFERVDARGVRCTEV